jgi:hypothetical protein
VTGVVPQAKQRVLEMTKTLIAASIAAVFSSTAVDAATHSPRLKHFFAQRTGSPVHGIAPSGVTLLLYDQFVNATTNAVFVDDSTSSSDSYDSEGADDFIVPAGGWTVQQFKFQGFAFNGAVNNAWPTTSNVFVYPDNAGSPAAAPECSYPLVADSYNSTTTVVTVNLPTACVLAAGKHWVGLQAVANFNVDGQSYFWTGSSPVANSGAVWRNPGDGTAFGCLTFTAVGSCSTGADPDFAFQVLGVLTPVTLQEFGVD